MILHKWLHESTKKRGGAKALVYRDTYLSWRGLEHRAARRAQEFASMGVARGQWVGLMLGNVPDFAILALALSKLGATVVPLDPTTGARDLGLILEHAPLRALVTRPRGGVEAAPQPLALSRDGEPVEAVESRRRLQGTLLTCSVYKEKRPAPGKAAVVLYTNQANGEPKGVLRTDDNLQQAADQNGVALDANDEDRILTTVPLYHSYGFDLGLCLALRFGSTLFLEDDVAAKRVVKILREQDINLLPGTPSLYGGLAKLPTAKVLKIKNARYLSSGSALPESIAEEFKDRLGLRIIPVYHMTETSMIACDRKGSAADSVGKPIEGVSVRVGDAKSNGAPASVWIKSKSIAQVNIGGRRPVRGEVGVGDFDSQQFLRSGDLATQDKSGRLFLAGREDHLVKVDGKRVALSEVEDCLHSFVKVRAAKVRVVMDPFGGLIMVASVVLDGKSSAEEIIDHCAKALAPYKVPRRIEFCQSLPGSDAAVA